MQSSEPSLPLRRRSGRHDFLQPPKRLNTNAEKWKEYRRRNRKDPLRGAELRENSRIRSMIYRQKSFTDEELTRRRKLARERSNKYGERSKCDYASKRGSLCETPIRRFSITLFPVLQDNHTASIDQKPFSPQLPPSEILLMQHQDIPVALPHQNPDTSQTSSSEPVDLKPLHGEPRASILRNSLTAGNPGICQSPLSQKPARPSAPHDLAMAVDRLIDFVIETGWSLSDIYNVRRLQWQEVKPKPEEERYHKYLELYSKVVPQESFDCSPQSQQLAEKLTEQTRSPQCREFTNNLSKQMMTRSQKFTEKLTESIRIQSSNHVTGISFETMCKKTKAEEEMKKRVLRKKALEKRKMEREKEEANKAEEKRQRKLEIETKRIARRERRHKVSIHEEQQKQQQLKAKTNEGIQEIHSKKTQGKGRPVVVLDVSLDGALERLVEERQEKTRESKEAKREDNRERLQLEIKKEKEEVFIGEDGGCWQKCMEDVNFV